MGEYGPPSLRAVGWEKVDGKDLGPRVPFSLQLDH